jgi:hypothetical protein
MPSAVDGTVDWRREMRAIAEEVAAYPDTATVEQVRNLANALLHLTDERPPAD